MNSTMNSTSTSVIDVFVRYREPDSRLGNILLETIGIMHSMEVPHFYTGFDQIHLGTDYVMIADNHQLTGDIVQEIIDKSVELDVSRRCKFEFEYNENKYVVDYDWK